MKFNEKITALRKSRNLSQEELGLEIGVTRQVIYRWEKGLVMPSVDNLVSLSDFFGMSVDSLVKDDLSIESAENITTPDNTAPKDTGTVTAEQTEAPHEKASPDEPVKIRVNGKKFAAAVIAVFLVIVTAVGIITAIIQSRIPESSILYISLRLNKLSFLVPLGIVAGIPAYILLVYFTVWAIKLFGYKIRKLSKRERNYNEDIENQQH